MQTYDIIIVGAGLIGTSLVNALQGKGFKIAIVEKHLPTVKTAPSEDRPISLAYASHKILETLGLWQTLAPYASKIERVHVSELGAFGSLQFNAQDYAVPALGFVVPYTALHLALYERAAAQADVDVIPISEITQISQQAQHMVLEAETAQGKKTLHAQLVIGCDGARSFVREYFKIPVKQGVQANSALTATVTFEQAYPQIAYERFCQAGVLALLPSFAKNQCGLVWTLPQDKLQEIKQWPVEVYKEFIEKNFRGRIPPIKDIAVKASFPLQTLIAEKQFMPHVLLLGNAAHTLYPLAAQGFNLGLRDVAALAEVLVSAKAQLENLGAISVLTQYVEWRLQDQARIAKLTEVVSKSFSKHPPLLRSVRGLGLLVSDLVTPVKSRLAKLTLGLSGKLPKLVRGVSL